MANFRQGNVVFVDTTNANFDEVKHVKSVKYIGNTSGTANIKSRDTSADILWEESGTANVYNGDINIRSDSGIEVEVTNGATVYVYTG